MTFEHAWSAISHAGRQLGSGPHLAVVRIVPNCDETADWMESRRIHVDRAGGVLLGIAVGLVMAEDEAAMQILTDIDNEWRQGHHG
jgi:hypothetical protein